MLISPLFRYSDIQWRSQDFQKGGYERPLPPNFGKFLTSREMAVTYYFAEIDHRLVNLVI